MMIIVSSAAIARRRVRNRKDVDGYEVLRCFEGVVDSVGGYGGLSASGTRQGGY